MKRIFWGVALCALFALLHPATSTACGDKFFVHYASVTKARVRLMAKPWAILMYRDPSIKATENALGKDMLRALKNAGLNIRDVGSRLEFESAINNEVFDVILLAYSATEGVEKTLREAGKNAKILPIVDAENETEQKLAREHYGNIIKDTDRTSTKILILSDVLLEAEEK